MFDFNVALRTTVLLVDDDTQELNVRALTMKMSGLSVVTANSPIEAISIINRTVFRRIDVVVIDYHMSEMNGCILAEYLKGRYRELKIVLYSAALYIPKDEMTSVDAFVSKDNGIDALLTNITGLRKIASGTSGGVHQSLVAWSI